MRIPNNPNLNVSIDTKVPDMVITQTVERQGAEGSKFSEVLKKGVEVLARTAGNLIRHLPGGEVVSLAISEGINSASNTQGGSLGGEISTVGNGGISSEHGFNESSSQNDLWRLTKESQQFNLFYLQLQEELSKENRRFTALSNVLRARHDTAKNAINNIK